MASPHTVAAERPAPSIAELDAAGDQWASDVLGPLFEDAPRFLARLAAERPFGSWRELFARADEVAIAMPEAEQVELLDAHPRIGAPPGTVSAWSYREQGYDLEQQQAIEALERLNPEYEARFGFRYVIFVAGRPRSEIVPLLERALGADRADELHRGLRDVVAIARDRAAKMGWLAREADR
jgi:2-oxo-4-hydroxy-4-carboxy--5-ureidoimidazoline (OHCU) decarboxylase